MLPYCKMTKFSCILRQHVHCTTLEHKNKSTATSVATSKRNQYEQTVIKVNWGDNYHPSETNYMVKIIKVSIRTGSVV